MERIAVGGKKFQINKRVAVDGAYCCKVKKFQINKGVGKRRKGFHVG